MPRAKKGLRVRAEARRVDQRGGEVVPAGERTSVDTNDLVVRKPVVLVLCHESLHTQKIQVPLVGILLQLTNLETGRRDTTCAVADAVVVGACAADTGDGSEST